MEETIFDACRKPVLEPCRNIAYEFEVAPQAGESAMKEATEITAAVIQAIIDRTPSPRCVEELTRILREGGVEVPEVTFD